MVEQNTIANNMEKIKTLFQLAYDYASVNENIDSLISEMENEGGDFTTVVYEAIAMHLAEKDISKKSIEISSWRDFVLKYNSKYSAQIHVGLGWALAKSDVEVEKYLEKINPFMISKVIDGMGYYDGVFKHRKAVKAQKRSDKIGAKYFAYYDQGVGRSIWYSTFANIDKTKEIIDCFSTDRKLNLWSGVGTACAFVGGQSEFEINNAFEKSGVFQSQFLIGSALAIKNRVQSDKVSDDSNLISNLLFNLSPTDLANKINELELKSENNYEIFITEIVKKLIKQEV